MIYWDIKNLAIDLVQIHSNNIVVPAACNKSATSLEPIVTLVYLFYLV